MNIYNPTPNGINPSTARTSFARQCAREAFGKFYPADGADEFVDRLPNVPAPNTTLQSHKRGRRRRLPSWRMAG